MLSRIRWRCGRVCLQYSLCKRSAYLRYDVLHGRRGWLQQWFAAQALWWRSTSSSSHTASSAAVADCAAAAAATTAGSGGAVVLWCWLLLLLFVVAAAAAHVVVVVVVKQRSAPGWCCAGRCYPKGLAVMVWSGVLWEGVRGRLQCTSSWQYL